MAESSENVHSLADSTADSTRAVDLLVMSAAGVAWQVGRELWYYAQRLADPELMAAAVADDWGKVAVPVGARRQAGMLIVGGHEYAEVAVRRLSHFAGYPDLRVDPSGFLVRWGAQLPVWPDAPIHSLDRARADALVGRLLGYSESAIRGFLTGRVGSALAEAVLAEAVLS